MSTASFSNDSAPAGPGSASSSVWRPVQRIRAYQLVVDRIEEQILSGTLGVGDRLPAERDLADMLGVSRAAVREAIRALEAQGVVRSALGRDGGTTVSALPAQALARFLRLHVALSNFAIADVVEARIMLERESAVLAARRRCAVDLAGIADLVEQMEASLDDRDAFNQLDTAFHVAIAVAGGNNLVADMTTAIRDSLRLPILRAFRDTDDWPALVADLQAGHRAIRDHLLAGDGAGAADAVEEHIRFAHEALPWSAPTAPSAPSRPGRAD